MIRSPLSRLAARCYATVANSPAEKEIADKLVKALKVQDVKVEDTSGGCGSMYRIAIAAEEFKGQSIVKQHQLVHRILKEDIAKWHGLVLETSSPK